MGREKFGAKTTLSDCLGASSGECCQRKESSLMPATTYTALAQEAEEDPITPPSNALQGPRPEVYYGEGPFDAPSSEDEGEELLKQAGEGSERADIEANSNPRPSNSPLWTLLVLLGILVLLATGIGISAGWMYQGIGDRGSRRLQRITMDHIFNGTFRAQWEHLAWVPEAGDGVYSIEEDGYIKLVDFKTNRTSNLVALNDVKDEHGQEIHWHEWKLSPDMKYLLVKTDHKKQWRHSSFGNYYVHRLEDKTTHPLIRPSHPPSTSYVTWSPTGETIAFVRENDIYLLSSASPSEEPIRITDTGNASLFNGVPDWVYEEEVFSSDSTLFFSPSSTLLAYLTFDESDVDTFSFPVYNPTFDNFEVVPYTEEVKMKYPKPGYNNPIVSLKVFDVSVYTDASKSSSPSSLISTATLELDWEGRHAETDSIIQEVQWVGMDTLMIKEVNRNSDQGNVVLFELGDRGNGVARRTGKVVRKLGKDGEEGDDGWIDHSQSIYPLPPSLAGDTPAYLDIVPNRGGYDHIALFSPATSSQPRWLTSGNWEVSDRILSIDAKRSVVYFQAAHPSSTERNIYSVAIPSNATAGTAEPTALTDTSVPSFYTADFSPEGGFYLLSYRGPNVPWQRVIQVGNEDFDVVLTNNTDLNETWRTFDLPVVFHSTISSDGYELNARELRPPRMDTSGRTKYAVLFLVYGGPASQKVDVQFGTDWHYYLAASLNYIVVAVDGRGTGFQGRKIRNPIKGNLGFFETRDQLEAARIWADKAYVDRRRIGIWGWSYGGFMSLKVVEADAGIHSLAMAVAPVTSWRLYDSIYTERYMNLPALNPSGYINASISNVTGFGKVDFLFAHGSGDDNVHYANSAHLLDMLTKEKIRNFRFRMFTDSDHSIQVRGAYRELHEWMVQFLLEKWGKGGRRRGW